MRKELGLIDWKAVQIDGNTITFQLDFVEPEEVSANLESLDALYITLMLDPQSAPSFSREVLPP